MFFLLGCALISDADLSDRLDADGDGVARPTDCDDADAGINGPGEWYADTDGDGFGGGAPTVTCKPADGFLLLDGDCDDTDATTFPDAVEYCNGKDDNCDGTSDEDAAVDAPLWYTDADFDSYGTDASAHPSCERTGTDVSQNGDCDDANLDVNPGMPEACDGTTLDDNCDGRADIDCDDDGYDRVDLGGDDCNDADSAISPGDEEACGDDIDNNCDGIWAGRCGFEGDIDLENAPIIVRGGYAFAHAGGCVAGGHDLDGDSVPDLVVCGAANDDAAGEAYLFFGPVDGDRTLSQADVVLDDPVSTFTHTSAVVLTDMDGDGADDLVAGHPSSGVTEANDDGWVTINYGPIVTNALFAAGGVSLRPANAVSEFGYDVSAAGDLNEDGFPDIIAGEPGNGTHGGGAAILLYGGSEHTLSDDIAVFENFTLGAQSGVSYVFLGPITSSLSVTEADASFEGEFALDEGGTVVVMPDTNADGRDDLFVALEFDSVVGAYNGAGFLITELGSGFQRLTVAASAIIAADAEYCGSNAANAGDVDANGTADILLAATFGGSSGATLFLTPLTGTLAPSSADGWLVGEDPDDSVGWAMNTLGDLDQDGVADFSVTADDHSDGDYSSGAAYLFFGGE